MGGQFSLAAFSIGETTLVAHYKYVYDGQGNIVQSLDITNEKCYYIKNNLKIFNPDTSCQG